MTFPCKDCITLPICKSQYEQYPSQAFRSAYSLCLKCSILTDYLTKVTSTDSILKDDCSDESYINSLTHVINFYSDNKYKGVICQSPAKTV